MSVSHSNFAQQIQFETRIAPSTVAASCDHELSISVFLKHGIHTTLLAQITEGEKHTQLCSTTRLLRKIKMVKQKKVY